MKNILFVVLCFLGMTSIASEINESNLLIIQEGQPGRNALREYMQYNSFTELFQQITFIDNSSFNDQVENYFNIFEGKSFCKLTQEEQNKLPKNDNSCYICLNNDNELYSTTCKHLYHKECLVKWLEIKRDYLLEFRCPYCQYNLKVPITTIVHYILDMINIFCTKDQTLTHLSKKNGLLLFLNPIAFLYCSYQFLKYFKPSLDLYLTKQDTNVLRALENIKNNKVHLNIGNLKCILSNNEISLLNDDGVELQTIKMPNKLLKTINEIAVRKQDRDLAIKMLKASMLTGIILALIIIIIKTNQVTDYSF